MSLTEQKLNGAGEGLAQTTRYGKNDALRYRRYVIFIIYADWTLELSILFLVIMFFAY